MATPKQYCQNYCDEVTPLTTRTRVSPPPSPWRLSGGHSPRKGVFACPTDVESIVFSENGFTKRALQKTKYAGCLMNAINYWFGLFYYVLRSTCFGEKSYHIPSILRFFALLRRRATQTGEIVFLRGCKCRPTYRDGVIDPSSLYTNNLRHTYI